MNKGFTLVEILMAVIILLIMLAISFATFANLGNSNALEASVAQVVSELTDARSKTLASVGDSQYGVHLDTNEIVLFTGSSYNSSDPDNVITSLNGKVEIANIALTGSGTDIIFNRLSGETSQDGTFSIRLKNDTTASTTITVYGTGIIETN